MRTLLSKICYGAGYASIPVSIATYMGKLTSGGVCADGSCTSDQGHTNPGHLYRPLGSHSPANRNASSGRRLKQTGRMSFTPMRPI